jgi:hypothetical protein
MKPDEKLKSRSWDANYSPGAFFFRHKYSGGSRLVAWTSDLSQLKKLVYSILDTFPEDVEVLLKARDEEFSDNFHRYYASAKLDEVTEAIRQNEAFVFSDGSQQFCIKRPDTDEHIALDDHGILFIYSDSKRFVELCRDYGFRRKKRKLIYANGHWHIRPGDSQNLAKKLIKELGLASVE